MEWPARLPPEGGGGVSVLAYLSPMGWPDIYSVCYS